MKESTRGNLRLSLAWVLAIFGWWVGREMTPSVSQTTFVFGSWDPARSGEFYAQRLHWALLGVVVGGLLLEMLPWRRLRPAGLMLLLFLPCLCVVGLVQVGLYGRAPAWGDLMSFVGLSLTGFVLIPSPARAARSLALGPGLALLAASLLSFWAVPRLGRMFSHRGTMRPAGSRERS
jgi:hypothetical protein